MGVLEVAFDCYALLWAHAQAELPATPQDIVGGFGPFVGDEIVELAFRKPGAEVSAISAGLVTPASRVSTRDPKARQSRWRSAGSSDG